MKEKIGYILNSKYIDFIFYFAFFVAAIHISLGRDFWYDEVSWTVRFVHEKGILEMLKELSESLYNLPLYYIVINWFYEISHNQTWLRIPSILATCGAIYYTQKFIVKYYGTKYRLLSYVLFLFTPIMLHIALQVRPYAFMFLFSAMSYYFYYERMANDKWNNIITFGVILTLLEYSHWYGGLLVACYGLTDFYLWLRKKVRFRCVASYIICFVLFLPWMIAVVLNHFYSMQIYWGDTKGYDDILRVLCNITGSKVITFFVLSAMMLTLYRMLFKKNVKNEKFVVDPLYHISWIIWGIWTAMWTYGYLVPEGSLVEIRYFFVCIPLLIILLIAFVQTGILQKIFVWVIDNIYGKHIFKLLFAMVVIGVVFGAISIKAKPMKKEFFGYQKLLQDMRNDVDENRRVLVLLFCEFFWKYYDDNIQDIDAATYDIFRFKNYSEQFKRQIIDLHDKQAVMAFSRDNLDNRELLENLDCVTAMRYYAKNENKNLYYTYKNNQEIYESFPYENLCQYDVMYIDTRFWMRFKYLNMFLNKYYEIEPYPKDENINFIEKLVRKNNLEIL